MNGVHDMGGMHGFGPVVRQENEPVFHEAWEGRVRALVVDLCKHNVINLDEFRFAVERIKPEDYYGFSYFEKWFVGLLILLTEKGILDEANVQEMARQFGLDDKQHLLDYLAYSKYLPKKEAPREKKAPSAPKYKPGDKVRVKMINPTVHYRAPRFSRGQVGIIKDVHGSFTLPETNIYSENAYKETVYLVELNAADIWGPQVPAHDKVMVDLWESYLEDSK
jgi:nitrile hydratase beta subunit